MRTHLAALAQQAVETPDFPRYNAPLSNTSILWGADMAGTTDDTPEDRNLRVMARWRSTGRVLVEALPYILK